ncbi:hypothetical protein [Massilia timonae]|uniref:hypothetical protein n=1 Tax=Massilia timonae TaxID=47229 RepID=UPI0023551BC5|nr:hypothetical protein [Massilia timonae]
MQHTKTPWRVGAPSQMGSVVADEPVPEIKGSDAVDYYGGHLIAESIAPRNAEFIVRACNAHDQLVTAVQGSHAAIDRLMARLIQLDPTFLPSKSDIYPVLRANGEALAAAGAA